ncbi:hypothetical protein BGZ92_006446, partial [Podila epicladia]
LGYIPVDWTGDAFDTNDWRQPTMSEATVIATFTKSLDAYVAGPKDKGFYCLEHDVNNADVTVAQKLIPLGIARKINIASVAVCESDPQPYQAGGTAPMPTTPGTNSTKPSGTTSSGASPSGTGAAVVKNSSASMVSLNGLGVAAAAVVVAAAGALLA